jgi:DNA-binding transcriptional LysR family regulator
VNVHHLEIFYHVARNGGISEAVRHFPYGIQQPAVSSQILQLEQGLGTRLFHRRPFRLTEAGERLYAFIRPFFGNVGRIGAELQGKVSRFVRIGASGPVLHAQLPGVLLNLRRKVANLRFSLLEATAPKLIDALRRDEIDLAVTTLHEPLPAGLHSRPLIEIPLTLLLPAKRRLRSGAELWKRDPIEEPLICLPAHEPVAAIFQRGLAKLGVEWAPSIVVSTLGLIETYVANGFGIGVSVSVPGVRHSAAVRLMPLAGFDPIEVSVAWGGEENALVPQLIEAFEKQARGLRSKR